MRAAAGRHFLSIVPLVLALAGCGPDAFLHPAEKQLGV